MSQIVAVIKMGTPIGTIETETRLCSDDQTVLELLEWAQTRYKNCSWELILTQALTDNSAPPPAE